MRAAVFAFSRGGCRTAKSVLAALPEGQALAFAPERLSGEGFSPLGKPGREFYGALFHSCDALIFVGAAGIAVREIAPHVRDKRTDPAVLAIDELGRYVIPLLSGHIGGANRLAAALAEALGATAVITTATDIRQRFSVDAWAVQNGCAIGSMAAAKAISAAILEGTVFLKSDFPVATPLPAGVQAGETGELGIYLSCRRGNPFAHTLCLIPKVLHLGIGCRKGTEAQTIRAAVEAVAETQGIDLRGVKCVCSIDLKAKEQGLLDYCRQNGWPAVFYSPEELRAVAGDFIPSAFVQSVTGVDNVCERAALKDAARLTVRKTAGNGVTVAVAEEAWEVRFE